MYNILPLYSKIKIRKKNLYNAPGRPNMTGVIVAYVTIQDELGYVIELDTNCQDYLENTALWISQVIISIPEVIPNIPARAES